MKTQEFVSRRGVPQLHAQLIGSVAAISLVGSMLAQVLPTSDWTRLGPGTNSPRPRMNQVLVYDSARSQVVMFGGKNLDGTTSPPHFADTWIWNGAQWSVRSLTTAPPARANAAAAFDSLRGVAVIFGGDNSVTGTLLRDTWTWNGSVWTQQTPSTSPPARSRAAMAFDPNRGGRVVLFSGGDLNGPPAVQQTWEWDGTTWRNVSPSSQPPARLHSMMTYDPTRGRVVLFGGTTDQSQATNIFNDTWTWDGTTWTPISTSARPTPRLASGMAFDVSRQRIVLFGGRSGAIYAEDTWELFGDGSWQMIRTLQHPQVRTARMEYDQVRQELVLFGGHNGSSVTYDDTWVFGAPRSAEWYAFGAGCPTGAPLGLSVDARPVVGSTVNVRLSALGTKQPLLFLDVTDQSFGEVRLPYPLPFFGPNCQLHIDVFATLSLGNVGGVATWPVSIPNNPRLRGLTLFVQGLGADLAINSFAMSNAVGIRVGS